MYKVINIVFMITSLIYKLIKEVCGNFYRNFTVNNIYLYKSMSKYRCLAFNLLIIGLIFISLLAIATPVFSGDNSDSGPVLNPRIEVLPSEGEIDTVVYVRIWDYLPNKQVIVLFGNSHVLGSKTTVVAKETTDATGYAVVNFKVDLLPGGRYIVTADDGTNIISAYFRIKPKVTLNATSGYVGDTISVSGSGFAAQKPINIYFDEVKVANGDTDDKGKFLDIKFAVIPSVNGKHEIKIQDSEANSITLPFTVRQKMSVYPTQGVVGQEIKISGSGFKEGNVTIYFDDQDTAMVPADQNGDFTATIKIPVCVGGTHKIKADDGTNKYFCDLIVSSSLSVSPSEGYINMQVTLKGSGFSPGFPITISYDNIKMDGPNVNPQGNFVFNFKVPKSKYGPHTITATDSVNTQKVIFTVESTPPLAPTLNIPSDGSRVVGDATFEWSPVTDPSGVLYVFQLASDAKFSKVLLSEDKLTGCSYTIPEDKKILVSQKTPYYWRIKAIDYAFNEGPWSPIGSFFVGYTFDSIIKNMPGWAMYALIALGLVLFGYMMFWLNRILRRANKVNDAEYESDGEYYSEDATDYDYDSQTDEWAKQ